MGYAGYVPAKLPPGKLEGLDAALKKVTSMECLEVLSKLCRNVVTAPAEEKYRRIRLSNAKIDAALVKPEGGMESLLAMGWTRVQDDGDCLTLPKGKMTMKEVRAIEDRKDALKKEMRSAAVSRSASNRSLKENEADPTKLALRAQLEADKLERAARGPVTEGSKAMPLGEGSLASAKDLGIQGNQGCC